MASKGTGGKGGNVNAKEGKRGTGAGPRGRPTAGRIRRVRYGAMSAGHAAVLVMGLLVLGAGLYLLVANGSIFTGPAIALPIIGVILVFLGLAETFVADRRARRA
ncbi:MAG TPA: hypothetical protein VFG07_09895 [Thermoplasmata archaeon]|nr:hypothetical protein [Thermoplasmata archaeon]